MKLLKVFLLDKRILWMESFPFLMTGITKLCTQTQLHPPPPSSFQSPPSSLEHPQYLDQNIAGNWAISPNLDQKIKSYPFWLKIGTHGIVEVLISNSDLDFWSSYPKINFWANFGPKIQSRLFCRKIGAHSILRMQIRISYLVFWNSNPKTHFCANFGQKSQSCSFFLKIGMHGILTMLILIRTVAFWIPNPKSIFGQIWTEKVKVVCFAWNLANLHIHTQYLEDVDSYFDISFLKF